MTGTLELSVVIPAYNGGPLLRRTLEALVAQDAPTARYEIVVVDDGSTDGSTDGLDDVRSGSVEVRLLTQPNRGRAAARNRGAAEARGRVVLFLDADVRAAPGLVAAHLQHHRNGTRLAVQGRTLQDPATLATTFMRARHLLPDLTPRRHVDLSPLHVATCNFSVTAADLGEVGGFDEAFGGYGLEDIELGVRLREAGVVLRHEPAALAYHCDVQTLDALSRKLRQSGEGAVYFWRKHGRPMSLGMFLEIHPVVLPLKWLVYRTGVLTRLVEAVRPWAERHAILPVCSECYNHLLWQAYYEGVFAALRRGS